MSKVDDRIAEVHAHNFADVMENGPRLSTNRWTAFAARCPTGKHVYKVGLGSMGLGEAWFDAESYGDDPELRDLWADLPVHSCASGMHIGCTLCKED